MVEGGTVSDLAPIVPIDQAAVLKALRLDPHDPNAQAALLICNRYQLDPILKHVVLIQGRPYITRDGLLAVAHRSGHFDGIEVVAEGETDTHWTASVAVWRDDMSHPFRYSGRHPKRSGNQWGPEMAVKCAEVMALRRAFSVTGVGTAEEQWDTTADPAAATATVIADDGATIGEEGAHDLNEWLRDVVAGDDRLRGRLRRWWDDRGLPVGPDGRPDLAALTAVDRDDLVDMVSSWPPDGQATEPAADGGGNGGAGASSASDLGEAELRSDAEPTHGESAE